MGAIQAASPLGFWRLDPSWPPFCAAVDWVVALAIGIEIVAGINLQS